MARQGSGFGFIILLVVLVVVTLLTARLWNETAPVVQQVVEGTSSATSVPDHGQPEASGALGELPNLNEMRSATDDHTQEVTEALAATE